MKNHTIDAVRWRTTSNVDRNARARDLNTMTVTDTSAFAAQFLRGLEEEAQSGDEDAAGILRALDEHRDRMKARIRAQLEADPELRQRLEEAYRRRGRTVPL